jgi:hypothetical protein
VESHHPRQQPGLTHLVDGGGPTPPRCSSHSSASGSRCSRSALDSLGSPWIRLPLRPQGFQNKRPRRSVSSATISLTTRQKITNVGSGTYDLGDRCSAFTCSASSERSGLSRFSVARSESPLLRVTKPRALLHHFCVLPTLVSPVRPPRFPGQRCDQLPANAMSCCALMPTGCGLRRANETPGRAFYGISCSRSTSAGGGRRLGLW